MFENLREAFREAVGNFRSELDRDAVPEAADRLLRAMRKELVEARTQLSTMESRVSDTDRELETETEALETCLRREELARKIGDTETADIARTFARRHLQRRDLLEDKLEVLRRELGQVKGEVSDMEAQFKRARVRRESLAAEAGRTDARSRLQEADDLFGELDRMADRIDQFDARTQAARDVEEALNPDAIRMPDPSSSTASEDVDRRLAELKRKLRDE